MTFLNAYNPLGTSIIKQSGIGSGRLQARWLVDLTIIHVATEIVYMLVFETELKKSYCPGNMLFETVGITAGLTTTNFGLYRKPSPGSSSVEVVDANYFGTIDAATAGTQLVIDLPDDVRGVPIAQGLLNRGQTKIYPTYLIGIDVSNAVEDSADAMMTMNLDGHYVGVPGERTTNL